MFASDPERSFESQPNRRAGASNWLRWCWSH